MNRLLTKTKEFIFAQQTSIFSSTLILAGMMVVSRIAGFLRYRILAGYFTAGELDVYFAAFKIPDLVFEILITGALSTTFIPFFIKYQRNPEEQSKVISSVINIITLVLFAVILILVFSLPYISPIITPGFSDEKTKLITYYAQIILMGQLPFLVLGNFLSSISQARKSFLIPSIVPIIYNIAIILCTLFLTPTYHLMAPVIGVISGSVLFFIFQLPILYFSHFRYQIIFSYSKQVWRFFKTAIPRIMTTIVAQIDATIDLMLTSNLASGAYAIFYFAQHLQLLPVSIIGIAVGQASLPYLTEIYQEKKIKEFKKIILDTLLNIFYLTIPIASFFIIADVPLVRLFFGGEKFDWNSTLLTSLTLSYFCLSLPIHSIYYFITRCFYAIFDTKTPFYTSIFSIALNATLTISFVHVFKLPVWSLALAFSLSITTHVILLLIILYRKIEGFDIKGLVFETIKIVVATFNSSVIVYFLIKLLDMLILDTTRTINVFFLLVISFTVYTLLYLLLTWLFGIREIYLLTKMLLKVKEYQRKIVEVYTNNE